MGNITEGAEISIQFIEFSTIVKKNVPNEDVRPTV